jgi:hypothetical protein
LRKHLIQNVMLLNDITNHSDGGYIWGEFFGYRYIFSFLCTIFNTASLRCHCVGGCWDRTQDSCDYGIGRWNIMINAHSCFIFSAELRSSSSHSNLSSNIEDLLPSGLLLTVNFRSLSNTNSFLFLKKQCMDVYNLCLFLSR